MQIEPLSHKSFEGLYVTPKTLKKIGCTKNMLLNNPSIKNCSEKYDVLVTAGAKKYVTKRHDGFTKDKILPAAYLSALMLSASSIPDWLFAIGATNYEAVSGIVGGLLTLAGLSIIKLFTNSLNEINIQGASKIEIYNNSGQKNSYYDDYISKGAKTSVYTTKINKEGKLDNIPDMESEIYNKEYKTFVSSVLKEINVDEMDTPEKYLEQLERIQIAAQNSKIEDIFKFPINRGGDTLLTKFFDIPIPDKNDFNAMETYYKIITHISKTNRNNFNQTDSNGVTNIEKIIKTENEFVFPFIKGCKFSYTPYLQEAYDNLHNDFFKNHLKLLVDLDLE